MHLHCLLANIQRIDFIKIKIANLVTVPNKIPVSISSELALKRPDIMQSEANLRATLF